MKRFFLLAFTFLISLGSANESRASIVCTSSTPTRVVVNETLATVLEGQVEIARFAVPAVPAMSTSNGSYAATFSSANFVLTILVDDLQPETLDGPGFVAYQDTNGPTSFEVECETEPAELQAPVDVTSLSLVDEPQTPNL